jgi:hypothetical protein
LAIKLADREFRLPEVSKRRTATTLIMAETTEDKPGIRWPVLYYATIINKLRGEEARLRP